MSDPGYDIFLSYNSRDRAAVEQLALQLRRDGFTPWLDAWDLPAGGDWQDGIDQGLRHSRGCAVFLGPHGFGDWQLQEMKVASSMAAHDPAFRFFLVLLPGAPEPLDSASLPAFINLRGRINLREGYTAPRQFQHLTNAILGVAMGPSVPSEPELTESPYRGLEPFDAEHAEFFFGRDAEIRKLLDKLRNAPFLAVIGPSGSGKSSLVLAGLIPALQNGQLPGSAAWPTVTMVPGPHPVESLAVALDTLDPQRSRNLLLEELQGSPQGLRLEAAALLRERPRNARLVVIVDQFEEVFTLCRDEAERETFLNLLLAATQPDGPCLVIITMRADFYPRITEYPALATEVETHQLLVGALTRDGLTTAIEQPAFRKGLQFEPGLVSTILADMGGDAGALPLLQYALDELWKRQHGGLLTLEGYRASGGVGDAIATRANAVFEELSPEQQAVARRILLRLTQPGEATEDTRRRAELDELITGENERPAIEAAVSALVTARLLTTSRDDLTGAPQVDVAHEALIRAWPRLRQWLDEDRQGLLVHRRLTEAAQEWQRADRDSDLLYRGSRLAEAVTFSSLQPDALNERERAFLAESTALREREQAAATEAAAARERLRKRIVFGLGAFSAVALLLALLAGWQWREAGQQAAEAMRQTGIAEERADAARTAEDEAQRQALVASNAEATAQAEADRAAQQAAVASTAQVEAQQQAAAAATAEVTAQNEATIALARQLAAQSSTDLGDLALNRLLAAEAYAMTPDDLAVQRTLFSAAMREPNLRGLLNGQSGYKRALAFNPDGTILASGSAGGLSYLWNTEALEPASPPIGSSSGVLSTAFSPDGRWLAIGTVNGEVSLWDVQSQRAATEPANAADTAVVAFAFSPDGNLLASAGEGEAIHLWRVPDMAPAGTPLTSDGGGITGLAFTPDGTGLVSGGYDDSMIRFWDLADRSQQGDAVNSEQRGISGLALSPDGSALYTAGVNGTILEWDVATRTTVGGPMQADDTEVRALSLSADGSTLAAGTYGGLVRTWDFSTGARIAQDVASNQGPVFAVALNADGTLLGSGGIASSVALWELGSPTPLFLPLRGLVGNPSTLAYSPDGRTVATGSAAGDVLLWDRASGRQLGPPLAEAVESFSAIDDYPQTVMTLAFSPDGQLLASGSGDGVMHLWNLAARTDVWRNHLPLGSQTIHKLAFSPDGSLLAVAGGDGTVRLWRPDDPASETIVQQLPDPEIVVDVDFTPNGAMLAALTASGAITFWDVETREILGSVTPPVPANSPEAQFSDIAFVGDGSRIAVVRANDNAVTYWSVPTGERLQTVIITDASGLASLERNAAGDTLASVSMSGDIFLWNAQEPDPDVTYVAAGTSNMAVFTPTGNQLAYYAEMAPYSRILAEWSPEAQQFAGIFPVYDTLTDAIASDDGSTVAASSMTGAVTVWNHQTGAVRYSYQAPPEESGIWRIALSRDAVWLATVSGTGKIQVWDIATGLQAGPDIETNAATSALAFSLDAAYLASGAISGTITVWDTGTGEPLTDPATFTDVETGASEAISSLVFQPEPDNLLLAFTLGQTVGLWPVGSPDLLRAPFTTASLSTIRATFSPDGRTFGYFDGQDSIVLWNMVDEQQLAQLRVGEVSILNDITISPDGERVAAATSQGEVPLWSAHGNALLGVYTPNWGPTAAVVFDATGQDVVAVDLNGRTAIWPAAPAAWRARACQIANRNLTHAEWEQFIGDPDDPRHPYRKTCPDLPDDTSEVLYPASWATPVPTGVSA